MLSCSVMSDFLQPARLFCPWEFSRQEYWSELPCFPPGDLPDPGVKSASLTSPALAVGSLPLVPPGKPETILFDPIMMDTYHRIFCKTHRMCSIKSKLQYKLWAIMMCHCGVIDCNKCTTLVRDVDNVGSLCVCMCEQKFLFDMIRGFRVRGAGLCCYSKMSPNIQIY